MKKVELTKEQEVMLENILWKFGNYANEVGKFCNEPTTENFIEIMEGSKYDNK